MGRVRVRLGSGTEESGDVPDLPDLERAGPAQSMQASLYGGRETAMLVNNADGTGPILHSAGQVHCRYCEPVICQMESLCFPHFRDGRVLGVLEVSRSIGDGQYKRCGVTSVPDIRRCQLTPNDR